MKTETKVEATPGPWETRKPRTPQDLVSHYVQSESANLAICKILKDQYRTNEEAEANAKLIAAAPDLLSSIQLALTYLEDGAKKHSHRNTSRGNQKSNRVKTMRGLGR